jgi:hypothetical protein
MLFTFAGFELGLAYTSLITAKAAWTEVQRLTDDHDQPGVDILLITAGAPDQRGEIYPAEEAIANFLLDNPLGLARSPKHIKQIWVHSWMTGRAAVLYPNIAPMFGPLYQGLAPTHHPLVAIQNSPGVDPAESPNAVSEDNIAAADETSADAGPADATPAEQAQPTRSPRCQVRTCELA